MRIKCASVNRPLHVYVTRSEKTPLISEKVKIIFIAPVESPKHADYTAALFVVIAHSFPEL